ncbi:OmpA family protein [Shimia ponticola]|uniref:OmpA family protein n=1 Tax=Shimia ponticola TaxID=2582893 RepID=UPI0011BF0CCA|nr:OmpA family protein [Shimia ponticola]
MNITKILKDHVPWVAPSVAIVLAATGFFDRGGNDVSQPAPASVAVAAAPQPAVAPAPAPAVETIAAAPAVPAAPVAAPAEQPAAVEVTRAEIVAPSIAGLANPTTQQGVSTDRSSVVTLQSGVTPVAAAAPQPAPVQQSPLSGANAASFFAAAQANLAAQNSCKADLRALVAQARVYFPSGGLNADAGGIEQARLIGTVAQNCPGVRIQVEGHSDASGNPAINERLSLQRAETVIQRIAASGIEEGLFTAKGFGSSFPSGLTGPQPSTFYDRRVEFSVIETVTPVAFSSTANFGTTVSSCVAELQAAVLREQLFFAPRSIAVQPAQMDSAYQLATKAAACPDARLRIVGQHTDAPGMGENISTGLLRAKALMSMLVARGVPAEQVIIAAPSVSMALPGQPSAPKSRIDFDVIIEDL